ncbi:MAG: hypothetical protein IPI48_14010 [bacterium]|nr:hypothetical protein [bacterium]
MIQIAVFCPAVSDTVSPLSSGQSGSGYSPVPPRMSVACVTVTYFTSYISCVMPAPKSPIDTVTSPEPVGLTTTRNGSNSLRAACT